MDIRKCEPCREETEQSRGKSRRKGRVGKDKIQVRTGPELSQLLEREENGSGLQGKTDVTQSYDGELLSPILKEIEEEEYITHIVHSENTFPKESFSWARSFSILMI